MNILGQLDLFKVDLIAFMMTGYKVLLPVLYTLGISFLTIDIMIFGMKSGLGFSEDIFKTIFKKIMVGGMVLLVIMPIWMNISTTVFSLTESMFSNFMVDVMGQRDWEKAQADFASRNTYLKQQVDNGVDFVGKENYINNAIEYYENMQAPSPFVLGEIYYFAKALIDPMYEGIKGTSIFKGSEIVNGLLNGILWLISWVLIMCIIFISLGIFLEFYLMSFLLGVMLPFTLLDKISSGIMAIIKPLFTMIIKIIAYVSIFSLFMSLITDTTKGFMDDGSGVQLTDTYIENSALVNMSGEELEDAIQQEIKEQRKKDITFVFIAPLYGSLRLLNNSEEKIRETMLGDLEEFQERAKINKYLGMFKYINFEPSLTIMLLFFLTFLFLFRLSSFVQGLTGGASDFNAGREGLSFMSQSIRTLSMASIAIRNPMTKGIGKTIMHGVSDQTRAGRGLVGVAYTGASKAVSAIRGTKTK